MSKPKDARIRKPKPNRVVWTVDYETWTYPDNKNKNGIDGFCVRVKAPMVLRTDFFGSVLIWKNGRFSPFAENGGV